MASWSSIREPIVPRKGIVQALGGHQVHAASDIFAPGWRRENRQQMRPKGRRSAKGSLQKIKLYHG